MCSRQEVLGCEIDLIFYRGEEIVFVEAKSGSCERVLERWMQGKQQFRQRRVVELTLERGFKASWILAVVEKGQVKVWNLLDMV